MEFTRGVVVKTIGVSLTVHETEFDKRYREITDKIAAEGREWSDLRARRNRSPEEEQRLKKVTEDLDRANQELKTFFNDLYAAYGKSEQAGKTVEEVESKFSDIQNALGEMPSGTVALYTLVTSERVFLIVVTPNVTVAREYPIKAEDLRRLVFQFRKVLDSPSQDPIP
jgi:hypothetical protein